MQSRLIVANQRTAIHAWLGEARSVCESQMRQASGLPVARTANSAGHRHPIRSHVLPRTLSPSPTEKPNRISVGVGRTRQPRVSRPSGRGPTSQDASSAHGARRKSK